MLVVVVAAPVEVVERELDAEAPRGCLERAQAEAAEKALRRAAGFLRSALARRIKMYTTPELRFKYDESVERGDRLSRLIDSVRPKE